MPGHKKQPVKAANKDGTVIRAVIRGKRYSTDKAKKVAERRECSGKGDQAWYIESLYVTAKQNWFLAGEGGPSSHWATPSVGTRSGTTCGIRPLRPREAMNWLEVVEEWDLIEEHFHNYLEEA